MRANQMKTLIKTRFINEFKLNRIFNKSIRTKRSIGMLLLFLYVYLMIAGQLAFYIYQLYQINAGAWIPFLIFLVSHLVLLYLNAFMAYNEFIAFKDFPLLGSLPISRKGLLVSRFLYLYLMDSIGVFLVISPSFITWAILSGRYVSALSWILLISLVSPLLAIGVTLIISMVTVRISRSFQQSQTAYNIINLIVVIILSTIPLLMSLRFMNITVSDLFGPRTWLLLARFQSFQIPMSQTSSIIRWMGLSVVIILLAMFILYKNFDQLSFALVNHSGSRKRAQLKEHSILQALIFKEFRLFLSLPIYFMNTAFMIISLPIGLLALMIVPDTISQLVVAEINDYIPYIAIILGGMLALTNTTSVSLSLEGKHINLLLSLPIERAMIYKGKVYFNLLLFLPPSLLSSLMIIWILNLEGVALLFTILIPFVLVVFSSWVGMLMNSFFQNYLWDNENQVVKQSMAVLLNILVIFGVCLLGWLMETAWPVYGSWSFTLVVGLATVVVIRLLNKRPIKAI